MPKVDTVRAVATVPSTDTAVAVAQETPEQREIRMLRAQLAEAQSAARPAASGSFRVMLARYSADPAKQKMAEKRGAIKRNTLKVDIGDGWAKEITLATLAAIDANRETIDAFIAEHRDELSNGK